MSAAAYAEVIGSPYAVWLGPLGTAFPAIDADPDTPWALLGVNGINNQGTEGVTVSVGSTESDFTPQGGTLAVKGWRTAEKLTLAFSIADLSIETFAAILDDATITTVAAGAGQAGEKSISLVKGIELEYVALLARGISPYDDGSNTFNAQYEFTRVGQTATQAPKYVKGTPAELACEFTIYGDVNGNDPAAYRAQTAVATS